MFEHLCKENVNSNTEVLLMKNNRTPLIVPVIWFANAGVLLVAFCFDLWYGTTLTGLVVIHGLCVVLSLAAAIASLVRYNKEKNPNEQEEENTP